MRLVVEDWVESQRFKRSVSVLFDESIKCYRVGAYRAAYVFSYLAFLTELKTRILSAAENRSVPANMWDDLRRSLNNENKWEEALLNCVNNGTHQVFAINQDLREQVFYWKNRRNDCVHYKNDLINDASVESFWSFLRTYLSRFILNGSRQSLLKKFSDHFNASKTVPNLSFDHLSKEVYLSVESREYEDFFKALAEDEYTGEFIGKIFDGFLDECHDSVTEALGTFLTVHSSENRRLFNELVSHNTKRLLLIKDDASRIRVMWHDKMFAHDQNDYDVLAFLLRNGMVPDGQVEELIEVITNRIIQKNYDFLPSGQDSDDMRSFGIYHALKMKLFYPDGNARTRVDWYNKHSSLMKNLLRKIEIDKEIVEKLNEIIGDSFHPYSFKNRLTDLFKYNPVIRENIEKVAVDNGIDLCSFFKTDVKPD